MLLKLIKTLIALQGGLNSIEQYPENYGPNLNDGDEFDFIVVGAGSAGSRVASRLSETSEWNVLLLEAGGYPSDLTEIPAIAFSLQDTDEDWQYTMESSETSCLSFKNKACKCPRGKGLGGSSSMNLMMYVRSTKYDHERWERDGNDGWDHASLVEYYKKFENVEIEHNEYYGTDGELHLTKYTSTQPLRQILMNAYEEMGFHEYTEGKPIGFMDMLLTIYQGTRQNTAKAFLMPAKLRKNMFAAINAQVSKVLVDKDKLSVYGVEVKIGDRIIKLKSSKEVILSAGTIGSPHILMNSGIGPKDHLTEMGIELVRDLKVGDNLQDHLAYTGLTIQIDKSAVQSPTMLQMVNELYQYLVHRKGSLSKIEVTNFANFFNTENITDFANIQMLQAVFAQQDPYLLPELLRSLGIPKSVTNTVIEYNQKSPLLLLVPVLLHPKSRGHIRLRNADPFSKPLITPNYLSDVGGEDVKVMLGAIKLLIKVTETTAFADYKPKIIPLSITHCQDFVAQSDDYLKCYLKHIATSLFHPVGTCKMGPATDPLAVVDPQLKVYGLKGVRVIDGSIIPTITSGNTNAPIIMIGEKGATLIKNDWIKKHDEL